MVALVKPLPDPATPQTPAEPPAPRMRLVGTDESSAVAGRIGTDRRIHPRRNLSLRIRGRRLDHSVDARREPFLNFLTRDVSLGGISAASQTRLNPGERVAIFFPPEGRSRGWDAYGRILRVEPDKQGCRVALSFDPLQAP